MRVYSCINDRNGIIVHLDSRSDSFEEKKNVRTRKTVSFREKNQTNIDDDGSRTVLLLVDHFISWSLNYAKTNDELTNNYAGGSQRYSDEPIWLPAGKVEEMASHHHRRRRQEQSYASSIDWWPHSHLPTYVDDRSLSHTITQLLYCQNLFCLTHRKFLNYLLSIQCNTYGQDIFLEVNTTPTFLLWFVLTKTIEVSCMATFTEFTIGHVIWVPYNFF